MDWALSLPSALVNEFRTEDDGIINIYTAEFINLQVSSLDLRGGVRLSKRQERSSQAAVILEPSEAQGQIVPAETRPEVRSGILSIFSRCFIKPAQGESAVTPQHPLPLSKKEWVISVESRSIITSDGVAITDVTKTWGYRSALISEAANKGILISGTLLDNAFGPLDRQAEELRRGIIRVAKEL